MIYDFITEADTGLLETISYSSVEPIFIGQIVRLSIKNKINWGICVSKVYEEGIIGKDFKIKPVTEILNYKLSEQAINFVSQMSFNTWNKQNVVLEAVLKPFRDNYKKMQKFPKVSTKNISSPLTLTQNLPKQSLKFNIYNDADLVLRIMYLIRNDIENYLNKENKELPKNSQILIICPDKSNIEVLTNELTAKIDYLKKTLDIDTRLDFYFSSNSTRSNNATIMSLLQTEKKPSKSSTQVIIGSRSSLFLPFNSLSKIILLEESDNNYIQEQNSLYFDTRDVSYVLAQLWNSSLDWVSSLPSSRTVEYKNKFEINIKNRLDKSNLTYFNDSLSHNKSIDIVKNKLEIKINEIDYKNNFSLFSQKTLEIMTSTSQDSLQHLLVIHPRRGNFGITKCKNCNHTWECKNCSSLLTTYKSTASSTPKLELVCHHCQTRYDYPTACPSCKQSKIGSFLEGANETESFLRQKFIEYKIYRFDSSLPQDWSYLDKPENHELENLESQSSTLTLSSKVFDPRIPYSKFQKIIFLQPQNLFAGIDYLSTEESFYALFKVFLASTNHKNSPQICFESPYVKLLEPLLEIRTEKVDYASLHQKYTEFMQKELDLRQKFKLPPFQNLLLLTVQDKNLEKAKSRSQDIYVWLKSISPKISPEIELTQPYPAKLLKRKGYFSYHILLKYPKNFKDMKKFVQLVKPQLIASRVQIRLNPRHLL
jgi:primosomal protein N'